jgi:hypothetical protein
MTVAGLTATASGLRSDFHELTHNHGDAGIDAVGHVIGRVFDAIPYALPFDVCELTHNHGNAGIHAVGNVIGRLPDAIARTVCCAPKAIAHAVSCVPNSIA